MDNINIQEIKDRVSKMDKEELIKKLLDVQLETGDTSFNYVNGSLGNDFNLHYALAQLHAELAVVKEELVRRNEDGSSI